MRKAVGPPGAFKIEPNLILEEISHPGVSLEDWTRQALSKLKRDFPSLRLIDVLRLTWAALQPTSSGRPEPLSSAPLRSSICS